MDRQKLKEELKRDEGIRLEAYLDSVGIWTIGVGHMLGPKRMTQITPDECEALLDYDISLAASRATMIVNVAFTPEDDVRFRAVVNMSFNLGDRLKGFKKFLAAYNIKDWDTAAREMMDSKWARQVGPRAVRLRDMILEGK
jgi:lysozyme